MRLPEKTNTPSARYTALIYGAPKIGKTTWCAGAPSPLFLATEPGCNFLPVHMLTVSTWAEFLAACGEIAGGEHEFQTVVVDTVDNLYKACSAHVCGGLGIAHESDLPYGKGWAAVSAELMRALTKLSLLPYSLLLVSHAKEREIKPRYGDTYTQFTPTLPASIREQIIGLVDFIFYCDEHRHEQDGVAKSARVLRTKPTQQYEAGDRTGRLPEIMKLDFAAFEAALKGEKK